MKPEDIKKSFDSVFPGEEQKRRMFEVVKLRVGTKEGKNRSWFRLQTAAAAACVLVLGAGIWAFLPGAKKNFNLFAEKFQSATMEDSNRQFSSNVITEDWAGNNEISILSMFSISGRQYIIMDEYNAERFELPLCPEAQDIGERIGEVEKPFDQSLAGSIVYRYKKVAGEAVVAVQTESGFCLYYFFGFEKYSENGDVDAVEYLRVYGVNSAVDIEKIEFIRYTNDTKTENLSPVVATITSSHDLRKFYDYYSIMKDSSDEYFEGLYNYRSDVTGETQVPPDYKDIAPYSPDSSEETHYAQDSPLYDFGSGETGAASGENPGSQGTNALENQVTLRIFVKDGIYFEMPYYIDFGFISRHKVSDDFSAFLKGYIK